MMKSVSKVFALLVLPLLAPALGHAGVQEVALGVTTDNEEYNELRQSVALLADGSYASVWTDRGGAHGARMQWVRPDGSEVFAGGGRSVTAGNAQESNAVVASNPAGGAFVALSSATADGRQVLVQSFDAAGNPRWPADGVFAAAAGHGDDQIEPQLLAASQGGVYLCFQAFHSIGARDRTSSASASARTAGASGPIRASRPAARADTRFCRSWCATAAMACWSSGATAASAS